MMPTVRRLLIGRWSCDPVVTSTVALSEKTWRQYALTLSVWRKMNQNTQTNISDSFRNVFSTHSPSSACSKRPNTKLMPIHAYTPSGLRVNGNITSTIGRKTSRQQLERDVSNSVNTVKPVVVSNSITEGSLSSHPPVSQRWPQHGNGKTGSQTPGEHRWPGPPRWPPAHCKERERPEIWLFLFRRSFTNRV